MDDRYSQDGLIHDAERLKELQALPLSRKIAITQSRIIEWYEHFNGNVYVSYSGGKDSTVLADLVHRIYPDVPMVYSNTGLEYLEVQKFARDKGAEFIRPDISFVDVIKTYGYPVVSKEVSEAIYYARRNGGVHKGNNLQEIGIAGKTTKRKQKELLGKRTDGGFEDSG